MIHSFVIDRHYTRYGGDSDRLLVISIFEDDRIHLGILVNDFYSVHLTSDDDYQAWLLARRKHLLTTKREDWFDATTIGYNKKDLLYNQFQRALDELWAKTKHEH